MVRQNSVAVQPRRDAAVNMGKVGAAMVVSKTVRFGVGLRRRVLPPKSTAAARDANEATSHR
jgi:hypothetical protein